MYGMVWLKKAVNLFGLFDDYVLNFLVSEATWIFSIFFSVYHGIRYSTCTVVYMYVYAEGVRDILPTCTWGSLLESIVYYSSILLAVTLTLTQLKFQ